MVIFDKLESIVNIFLKLLFYLSNMLNIPYLFSYEKSINILVMASSINFLLTTAFIVVAFYPI